MKKAPAGQGGFTIIELIVVIALLGILSAVALPRFMNLTTDARISVLEGVSGSVNEAASLVYSKALIKGVQSSSTNTTDVVVEGTVIDLHWGYPRANVTAAGHGDITAAIKLSDGQLSTTSPAADKVRIGFDNADGGCYLEYTEPDATSATADQYETTLVKDNC
ncbi:Tfp pilus assembly protein FimT/FimU [Neptuniibacter sp. QD37_11]|uniref:pilus assembly FimT family protein n=1 Tax=Neptuniibacter sp. QD37_11 TaxID=3398209 RepID=UPI0039F64744